jgi:hypothetical protein
LVSQQLDAFKARDFAAAFDLASVQFQAISSVADLEALINDGRHAEVLDSVSHVVGECRMVGPDAVMAAVTVTGSNGQTIALAYQLVLEEGHWKILMSRPMGGHGDIRPSEAASLSA